MRNMPVSATQDLSRDSINPSSAFHLASVSKTFTGMAVLKLQEQGRLRITDEVSKYLPGFPLAGVTIKSLLNHRSGIPNYVPLHGKTRLGQTKTHDQPGRA